MPKKLYPIVSKDPQIFNNCPKQRPAPSQKQLPTPIKNCNCEETMNFDNNCGQVAVYHCPLHQISRYDMYMSHIFLSALLTHSWSLVSDGYETISTWIFILNLCKRYETHDMRHVKHLFSSHSLIYLLSSPAISVSNAQAVLSGYILSFLKKPSLRVLWENLYTFPTWLQASIRTVILGYITGTNVLNWFL